MKKETKIIIGVISVVGSLFLVGAITLGIIYFSNSSSNSTSSYAKGKRESSLSKENSVLTNDSSFKEDSEKVNEEEV